MQRQFDIENEKDMQDLWDILPDGIIKISPNGLAEETSLWSELNLFTLPIGLIRINWHDKTEITRPVNYKNMIGCVGWFSSHKNTKKDDMIFGILDEYNKDDYLGRCFYCHCDTWYKYFFSC